MHQYTNDLKKTLCEKICIHGASTIKTAQDFNVPLKTLEKWITAYNKDNNVFDVDDFSPQAEINKLNKTIKEQQKVIDLLKKLFLF